MGQEEGRGGKQDTHTVFCNCGCDHIHCKLQLKEGFTYFVSCVISEEPVDLRLVNNVRIVRT